MIKDLVISYISPPEYLILMTISMKGVFYWVSTKLIRWHWKSISIWGCEGQDPLGARSISLFPLSLTIDVWHPEEGRYCRRRGISNMTWRPWGKSYQLLHGYYATCLACSKEMNLIWEESCQKERNFFQSKEPWHHVDKNQVRVEPLKEAFSQSWTFPCLSLIIHKQV